MLDEKNLMLTLERHWDYSGRDEDVSHEIYHDDAVLEFPQSGERFEGWRTSGSGVGSTLLTSRSTLAGSLTATTCGSGKPHQLRRRTAEVYRQPA
jgi:hypothetical protein